VEKPHDKGSALYKYPAQGYKNNLESSTVPNNINTTSSFLLLNNMCF